MRPTTPAAATARYGPVARALHWSTVAAMTCQFVIGYTMDADGRGRGRGRGRGGGPGRGRGRGGDLDVFDNAWVTAHVALGLGILVLAVVRLWWRRRVGLPPWAPTLGTAERTLAHRTERALYTLCSSSRSPGCGWCSCRTMPWPSTSPPTSRSSSRSRRTSGWCSSTSWSIATASSGGCCDGAQRGGRASAMHAAAAYVMTAVRVNAAV